MTKPPLIRRLTMQNFLSYGPGGVSVDLLPLNVLIGPNASGKSNLLEAHSVRQREIWRPLCAKAEVSASTFGREPRRKHQQYWKPMFRTLILREIIRLPSSTELHSPRSDHGLTSPLNPSLSSAMIHSICRRWSYIAKRDNRCSARGSRRIQGTIPSQMT